MAVEAMDDAIDRAPDSWTAHHLMDVQQRLRDLYTEACDDALIWESEAPRQAAEARLAYHTETDTLDLYRTGIDTMKNYTIATERNGDIIKLDIPAMAMRQAQAHADSLRKMMPSIPVYVINLNAI
jgi:hypothetical protein